MFSGLILELSDFFGSLDLRIGDNAIVIEIIFVKFAVGL